VPAFEKSFIRTNISITIYDVIAIIRVPW